MGDWVIAVYSQEQQDRLNVDAMGHHTSRQRLVLVRVPTTMSSKTAVRCYSELACSAKRS
eukprot:COSAG05_NODE_25_length_31349_cov_4.978560_14_plen_60_part_00